MGLIIKKNKHGQYNIKSSISDESLHKGKNWISEDEAKRLLIERAAWKFIESAIEIDMTFPNGYHINDKLHRDDSIPNYHEWYLGILRSKGDTGKILGEKYEELKKRLNLDFEL